MYKPTAPNDTKIKCIILFLDFSIAVAVDDADCDAEVRLDILLLLLILFVILLAAILLFDSSFSPRINPQTFVLSS